MKWIKGTEVYTGGELRFIQDGEEYISYSPTEDFLLEQGWTKVEDDVEEAPQEKSLVQIKEEIIMECNEFYRTSILQFSFKGQIIWIPFETRQAYRTLLEDLRERGISQVVFRDTTLEISEAMQMLRDLNVYEYTQKQICDQHVREIIKLENEEDLYSYDFTADYDINLTF